MTEIVLGVSMVAAIAGVVALAFRYAGAKDAAVAALDLARGYQANRDDLSTRLTMAQSQITQLQGRLTAAETERNDAYRKAADEIKDRIRRSDVADAAATVDRLLAQPILPAAGNATATGDGGGKPTVQTATVAAAHPAAGDTTG